MERVYVLNKTCLLPESSMEVEGLLCVTMAEINEEGMPGVPQGELTYSH